MSACKKCSQRGKVHIRPLEQRTGVAHGSTSPVQGTLQYVAGIHTLSCDK